MARDLLRVVLFTCLVAAVLCRITVVEQEYSTNIPGLEGHSLTIVEGDSDAEANAVLEIQTLEATGDTASSALSLVASVAFSSLTWLDKQAEIFDEIQSQLSVEERSEEPFDDDSNATGGTDEQLEHLKCARMQSALQDYAAWQDLIVVSDDNVSMDDSVSMDGDFSMGGEEQLLSPEVMALSDDELGAVGFGYLDGEVSYTGEDSAYDDYPTLEFDVELVNGTAWGDAEAVELSIGSLLELASDEEDEEGVADEDDAGFELVLETFIETVEDTSSGVQVQVSYEMVDEDTTGYDEVAASMLGDLLTRLTAMDAQLQQTLMLESVTTVSTYDDDTQDVATSTDDTTWSFTRQDGELDAAAIVFIVLCICCAAVAVGFIATMAQLCRTISIGKGARHLDIETMPTLSKQCRPQEDTLMSVEVASEYVQLPSGKF